MDPNGPPRHNGPRPHGLILPPSDSPSVTPYPSKANINSGRTTTTNSCCFVVFKRAHSLPRIVFLSLRYSLTLARIAPQCNIN